MNASHDATKALGYLREHGLLFVIKEATEILPQVRLKIGINDVVVFALCRDEGDEVAVSLYGVSRVGAVSALEKGTPEAVQTIALLKEPVDVGNFILVVQHDRSLCCVELPVPTGTAGVLN